MYRVGWPLWKLAARAGIPLTFGITIYFDSKSNNFEANSPHLKEVFVTGEYMPEVKRKAILSAQAQIELQLQHHIELRMH